MGFPVSHIKGNQGEKLTTHFFLSASYASPLFGYITIGLLVTCKKDESIHHLHLKHVVWVFKQAQSAHSTQRHNTVQKKERNEHSTYRLTVNAFHILPSRKWQSGQFRTLVVLASNCRIIIIMSYGMWKIFNEDDNNLISKIHLLGKAHLSNGKNQSKNKSWGRAVDSNCHNFVARFRDWNTFKQRVSTNHVHSIFGIEWNPCRYLNISLFKKINICLHTHISS